MPDLLSHSLLAYIVRARPTVPRRTVVLFLVGTVIPDAVSHLPSFGLRLIDHFIGIEAPRWFDNCFYIFHSPIPLLLFAWLLALVAPFPSSVSQLATPEEKKSLRLEVFLNLTLGAWLHVGLDMLQRHISPVTYFPFYPFSEFTWELGWIWTEHSIYAIPPLLLIALFVAWRRLTFTKFFHPKL